MNRDDVIKLDGDISDKTKLGEKKTQLQEWLNRIKQIPNPQDRQRSLMDITGVTHHENMWSDIYRFFFDTAEEHGMNDLFIRSLEQTMGIIPFLDKFDCLREYVVDDNKRIDLLLYDKQQQRAIIIENKVFHSLDNDLNLYQRSVSKLGCHEIKTVVLGLHKYGLDIALANEIKEEDKFSITHKDLLDRVKDNISNYLEKAKPQFIYLLQEFYKNINNHTNMIDPNILDFFCKDNNQRKIVELHDVYKHITDKVTNVMTGSTASILKSTLTSQGMRIKSEREYVKYIFPDNEKVMLTVFYIDRLFYPPKDVIPHIYIVLELQDDVKETVLKDEEHYKNLVSNLEDVMFPEKEDKNWLHFASQSIPFADLRNDLPCLAEKVNEYVTRDAPLIKLGNAIIESMKHPSFSTVSD